MKNTQETFYSHINLITPKNNKDAWEHFIKSHYLRPDKDDRGFDEYKHNPEYWTMLPEDFEKLPKIISMMIYYDTNLVLTIIMELEDNPYSSNTQISNFMLELKQMDSNPYCKQLGMENTQIIYQESY